MSQKQIVYLQFGNPGAYPPVCHSSRILAEAGWKVQHFGLQQPGTETLKLPEHPNIDATFFPPATHKLQRLLSYQRFFISALTFILRTKPKAIYASDPFITTTALALRRITNIPVIYHEHDLPTGRQRRTSEFSRARLSQEAALRIFPNRHRGKTYQTQTSSDLPTLEVFNCPSLGEIHNASPKFEEPTRLIYHGSIVPTRLPTAIIEALAKCPGITEFTLIGYETRSGQGHVERLMNCAKELGCHERVNFLGVLPRSAILQKCSESTIGMSLFEPDTLNDNERTMPGASVKVFEYLSQGVVPIVNSNLGWECDFISPGYALGTDPRDPNTLAEAFEQAITKRSNTWFTQVQEKLKSDWNYEAQFAPVIQFLEEL